MWTTLLLLCVVPLVYGHGPNFWKYRDFIEKNRIKYEEEYIRSHVDERTHDSRFGSPSDPHYVTQPLDHFDPSVKGTFQQRYYMNSFMIDPFDPVFIYIQGEGALSPYDAQRGEHVELAKRYGALVLAVEHRFYGSSINQDGGLEMDQLQYLSSQQALADLANFVSIVTKEYLLGSVESWVCFGGSYAGALSAWFRLKYPHIVQISLASSAPVQAVFNFEGYHDVVSASLSDPVVGGSEKCHDYIRAAFQKVDQSIDDGNLKQLASDFKSCAPISSHDDISMFATNLAGNLDGTVQYNNEVGGYNIKQLCIDMMGEADPYASLKAVNAKYLSMMGQTCSDNSYKNFEMMIANTTVDRNATGVGLRQWIYQTCSQFGYYQTCDTNTTCPFSKRIDLNSSLKICRDVFNISDAEVRQRVSFTNTYYGGNRPKGSRIIFVNGSIDPWHYLSVLKNITSTETSIYINGTAHCANMMSDSPHDTPALKAARLEIEHILDKWIHT